MAYFKVPSQRLRAAVQENNEKMRVAIAGLLVESNPGL